KPLTKAVGNVGKKAAEMGSASAATVSQDPEQDIIEKAKGGGAIGAVFAITGMLDPKSKLLGQVMRQFGSRALGALAGQYDPGDKDLVNRVFNEALYTWFSKNGIARGEARSKLVERAKQEATEVGADIDFTPQYDAERPVIETAEGTLGPVVTDRGPYNKGLPRVETTPPIATAEGILGAEGQDFGIGVGQVVGRAVNKLNETLEKRGMFSVPGKTRYYKPGAKQEIEYVSPAGGAAPHADESGWSPESIARDRNTKFFILNRATGKISPLPGIDAVDIRPKPGEVKLQSTVSKPGYEVVETGDAAPAEELSLGMGLGQAVGKVTDKLNSALAKRGLFTDVSQRSENLTSAKAAVDSATKAEKGFVPGLKTISNFRRFGKAGSELADKAVGFMRSKSQGITSDLQNVVVAEGLERKVLRAANLPSSEKDIYKRIADIREGKVSALNIEEREAVNALGGILDRIAERAKNIGLKIKGPGTEKDWTPRSDYYPVNYKDIDAFLNSTDPKFKHLKDQLTEKVAELFPENSNPKTRDEALAKAKRHIELMRQDMKTRRFGHLEYERLLTDRQLAELKAEWESANPGKPFPLEREYSRDSFINYMTGAHNRVAWTESFGPDVSGKTHTGGLMPKGVYDALMNIKSPQGRDYVQKFFRDYINREGFSSRKLETANNALKTLQTFKLAFASIPNAWQWATNTLPQLSLKDAIGTAWDTLSYYGEKITGRRTTGKRHKFFAESGAGSITRELQKLLQDDREQLAKVASVFLKANLFSGTELNNAIFASFGGARKVRSVGKKLGLDPNAYRAPAWEEQLRKLGMSAEDIVTLKTSDPKLAESMKAQTNAAWHMKRMTQFIGEAFDLPSSWENPAMRKLSIPKYKGFPYNQLAYLSNEVVRPAYRFAASGGKDGSLLPLVKALPLLAASSYVTVEVKKKLYGFLGLPFYEELLAGKNTAQKALVYLLNTGNLGIAFDAVQAAKMGQERLASFAAGPVLSDVAQFAEAATKTIADAVESFRLKNPAWITDRTKRISAYWAKFGERTNPAVRVVIANLFKDYAAIKNHQAWAVVYQKARAEYMKLYAYRGTEDAESLWTAFLETQGGEYYEQVGKAPEKPTLKEVSEWLENSKKLPGEDVLGKSGGGPTPKF
ncbi:MAG: hypothetical protein M0R06_22635, partial [Sphaerochaeta sp.]|nr:hypothetical protein [Sphaerochaeta sp.]